MSVFTALYRLLIGPLELFFELIFAIANNIIHNPGLSIIVLSLMMNFLVLPLYRRADAMQEEERETEARLSYWVKHIKQNFKGDERFMMLQTYYRQNNYKPTYALRGSVSLLLEIPFFIAAYNMLSGLELLHGVSFGPIRDLGAPDGLLVIAGLSINLLPILMTCINLVTSLLYTKGLPLRSKIQLYGMALIFLVLLYHSPAGLVFYWTLNNVFSLVKTIFYKLKHPRKVLNVLFSAVGVLALAFIWFIHPIQTPRRMVLVTLLALALQLPALTSFLSGRVHMKPVAEAGPTDKFIFYGGCLFMALLTGVLIPAAVIKSSPEEFVNLVTFVNPLMYVLNSGLIAFGTFVIWFSIFYALANPTGKTLMGYAMLALSGIAFADYMFFGKGYGTLSSSLKYNEQPVFTFSDQLLNAAVLAGVCLVLYLLWKHKKELVRVAYIAMCLAVLGMGAADIYKVQSVIPEKIDRIQSSRQGDITIPLHRGGQNVMVIMMDRAINSYIPYIFHEKPEVAKQFDGFTYYPNTISYGAYTNTGSPALFGGYEYTPEEMNKRDTEPLESKHNEALKVMPVLFSKNGYEVTVCDPTYAGYDWYPDLTIYEEYPEISTYITMRVQEGNFAERTRKAGENLYRNFFCYSLFKIAPVFAQPNLYNDGTYNNMSADASWDSSLTQSRSSISTAIGMDEAFMTPYNALKAIPSYFEVSDSQQNTFMVISNDTTHEPMLLQEPNYEPAPTVDNTEYDALHSDRFTLNGKTLRMEDDMQVIHYHANVAAMTELGKWFDFMRENGVYDNTRIIIVSDHGSNREQLDGLIFGEGTGEDAMFYNPLLLVKDFGSTGFTTDLQFMTNGDVPTLATEGLIDQPTNPFTGKPISSAHKEEAEQHIMLSYDWDTLVNNGNTFIPGKWFALRNQDIFQKDNWSVIDDPTAK